MIICTLSFWLLKPEVCSASGKNITVTVPQIRCGLAFFIYNIYCILGIAKGDLILTEARFSVVNRVRNGVLFSNLDGLLILISCEHGKNSHKSVQSTVVYGRRDKDVWKAAECLHVTFGRCSGTRFCSGVPWRKGCLRGAASGSQGQLDPGSALLPERCSPALHVFHMCHDSPLTPQRVWFSQKWEDLAGQHRNVKGLMTDFPPLCFNRQSGQLFLLCCLKGQASFSSWKASLQLIRAIIFRPQCPISDFGSKEIYIHLYV